MNMIKNRVAVFLLVCLMLPILIKAETPSSFIEVYSALRQKQNLPDKAFDELEKMGSQESVTLENRLVSQVLAVAILSSKDIDDFTKKSITICDKVIKEYPDSWEADYLRFARLTNYGLLADYKNQIPLAKAALEEIKFDRLDTEKHEFLKICRESLGLSGHKMKNEILSILGYAYRMTGSFDDAKNTYSQIDDVTERKKQLQQVELLREKYLQQQRLLQEKAGKVDMKE